jgi:hypothetical protein
MTKPSEYPQPQPEYPQPQPEYPQPQPEYLQHQNACFFSIPIVLHLPIQLQPEVSAAPTTCVMPNGYKKQEYKETQSV